MEAAAQAEILQIGAVAVVPAAIQVVAETLTKEELA